LLNAQDAFLEKESFQWGHYSMLCMEDGVNRLYLTCKRHIRNCLIWMLILKKN